MMPLDQEVLKATADEILDAMPEDGRPMEDRINEAVLQAQAQQGQADAVERAVEVFRRYLHLPDPGFIYAVMGAVAANRLPGDPVWVLGVGPPGGGKTEPLVATAQLPDVHPTATLTEAALLSGTPKRDTAKDAKGGLLREIGDFGIVLCKDFGSVLNMRRDKRAEVLAALREVYDGSWTRHVGTDGGKTLHWGPGKVGLIGGCTQSIDQAHGVMAAMGERFLLYRLPEADPNELAAGALAHVGREAEMRAQLSAAVAQVFAEPLGEPRPLAEEERRRLIALATFAVRARSPVERDGHSREIELIPSSEVPTRLVKVLERLLAGLDVIGVEREVAWSVVQKAAIDCVPALRWAVVQLLAPREQGEQAQDAAAELGYPTGTTRRALEDLAAHGIVRRLKVGGDRDLWELTDTGRTWLYEAVPEMSPSEVEVVIDRGAHFGNESDPADEEAAA